MINRRVIANTVYTSLKNREPKRETFTKDEAELLELLYPEAFKICSPDYVVNDFFTVYDLEFGAYETLDGILRLLSEEFGFGLDSISPKTDLKHDKDKPIAGCLQDFSRALYELSKLMTFGANKYERGSWLHVENGRERYNDAFFRHILKERVETVDPETDIHHDIATLFNDLARIELRLREEEKNA